MKPDKLYPQPHPIVSPYGDDIVDASLEFELGEITTNGKAWQIPIALAEISSVTHKHLIDGKKATWGLHVECPQTLWRQLIPWNTENALIELPTDSLSGKVSFFPCIYSLAEISKISFDRQHADYGQNRFNLVTGDFLAVGNLYHFDAFLDYDPIEKIASILQIAKHETLLTGPMKLNLNGDRQIIVTLPQKDYNYYSQLRERKEIAGILLSSIIQPVLLQAINHIGSLNEEEQEEAKNQLWIRSILKKLNETCPEWKDSANSTFQASQQILKNPANRALSELADLLR